MSINLEKFSRALAQKPLLVANSRFIDCQRMIKSSHLSLASIADVIILDPALSMLVLRYVNRVKSRSHNPIEISSVTSALNLLGENVTRNLIGSCKVLEHNIKNKKQLDDCYQLLDRVNHAAQFAQQWSIYRKDPVPDETRVAALLRDVGELALCTHYYDIFTKIKTIAHQRHVSLSYAATKVLGFSLIELSQKLATHWFLPDIVRESMNPGRHEFYRPQGVMLASECARLAEFGWYHHDMLHCKLAVAGYLNVGFHQACKNVHSTTLAVARAGILHKPSALAAQLVLRPFEIRKRAAQQNVPQTAAPAVKPAPAKRINPDVEKMRRAKIYAQCVQHIKARAASGGATTNELIKLMMYGLHKGVGMQRVAFAMFDAGGKSMSVKLARGAGAEFASRVSFPCAGRSLFGSMMTATKAIWINKKTFIKFHPLIPDAFSQQVLTDDFICISLFCCDRPMGMIYMDNKGGKASIADCDYQRAKSLVLFAGKAVTRMETERRAAKKLRALKLSQKRNQSTGNIARLDAQKVRLMTASQGKVLNNSGAQSGAN